MSKDIHKKKHLSSFQLIILGFAGVILLGAIILMLPVSSAEGVITPFNQTLFTSTSAVCVTGLAVLDTGSYWSVFGQVVILLLIQIGGLGVVTVAVSVFMLSGRKISLMQRSTMQNAISAHKVGGIVRLTKFILKGTLFIEMAGALALLPVFYHDFGRKGIWMAVFHTFRSQENVETFGRRIEYSVIKNASTIAMMYCMLFLCGGITISVYEGLPLLECLYEAASAVGTVGLTLGITPKLHIVSQFILIILMYLGRVGGLTLIYAVLSKKKKGNARLPLEKLTVG